ncbi:MAG: CHASE domain-containing protein [Panacagrimonas sp.]
MALADAGVGSWIGSWLGRRQGADRLLALCLLLSLGLGAWVAQLEHRNGANELRARLVERTEVLTATLRGSTGLLYALSALHASSGDLDPAAFSRFARAALARYPELQAIEWIPAVPAGARAAAEAAMRLRDPSSRGFTEMDASGALVPAGPRAEYFPVFLVEPYAGNETAYGLDLGAEPQRREALERARRRGLPAATAPLRLAQETGRQSGILVFHPVFAHSGDERGALAGFALLVFRSGRLIAPAFGELLKAGGRVEVYDHDSDQGAAGDRLIEVFQSRQAAPEWARWLPWQPARFRAELQVEVGGRRWQVRFEPDAQQALSRQPWQALSASLTALLLSLLLWLYLRTSARQTRAIASANRALQNEILERGRAVQAAEAANRAKSDFLSSMSHEIRTPLNAVLGYAQLLRRDEALANRQRDAVNAIIISGNHLLHQLNDGLDLAKIETGRAELQLADFDLNQVLRDLELMFQPRCREKRLNLRIELLPAADALVRGDAFRLRQILINLCGNAVRFTRVGEVYVGGRRTGGRDYRFDVIDTGPGIAEDEVAQIFEPFRQGRARDPSATGTGLGLAIAQRLAELMQGSIRVVSEPGTGSRFSLVLPLPAAELPQRVGGDTPYERWSLLPGMRLSLLVLDDDAANRDVLARLLEAAGCTVRTVANADQALREAAGENFDAVFVDLRLGESDGLDVARRLSASPQPPLLIAYSAAVFEDDRARARAAGCAAFITKPLQLDDVFQALDRALPGRLRHDTVQVAVSAPLRPLDYSRLQVPESLLTRLQTAAELHSATVLRSAMSELRTLGGQAALLADHLQQLMNAYDMDAIARLLVQVPEAPAAVTT